MNQASSATRADMAGDRPLTAPGQDRLGFSELAAHLAVALIDRATGDGMVVGLEGAWGSGKSSLLALTTAALDALPSPSRPATVAFSPWLIGNRDALLTALFVQLASAVDRMQLETGDATGTSVTAMKDLAGELRRYGGYLGALAPVASLAALVGVPGATLAEKALKSTAEMAKRSAAPPDLEGTKAKIDTALRKLGRRIVVTIDDVDRLEPGEIAEVLRLVRSVADFHNVTYVLCYDPEIVAEAVRTAMRIDSGRAYLEKIVQVAVRVPAPEPFALRAMFSDGLAAFMHFQDEGARRRLASVVDVEGGRWLTTPRAVNRALDAIRFVWPVLRDRVDPGDLVWLQLTRLGNPDLFDWIEAYAATMAAVATGRVMLGRNAAAKAAATLTDALGKSGLAVDEGRMRLREFLPGIGLGAATAEKPSIYGDVSERDRLAAIAGRRLSSPDHWRLYFALANPNGAVLERDYDALWAALDEGKDAAIGVLSEWLGAQAYTPSSKAEVMLDRLRGSPPDRLTPDRARVLVSALADVLDDPRAVGDVRAFLGPSCWREGEYLLQVLRDRIGHGACGALLDAFRNGAAIGWLTYLFRSETFSHGRHGDQRRPEREWLLTEPEWDQAAEAMLARYASLGMAAILATPDPLSLLYGWIQGGGAEQARSAVEDWTADDGRLLEFLGEVGTTLRSSTDGETQIIRKENLEAFFDLEALRGRVTALANAAGPLQERAREILERIDQGRSF